MSSLWNHPFFTISCILLLLLFISGIHKRVIAPSMYPLYTLYATGVMFAMFSVAQNMIVELLFIY